MRTSTKTTITLDRNELSELYGQGKPTTTYVENLNYNEVRNFLGLQRYEYKDKSELVKTLKGAKAKIEYLNKLVPNLDKKIKELEDISVWL